MTPSAQAAGLAADNLVRWRAPRTLCNFAHVDVCAKVVLVLRQTQQLHTHALDHVDNVHASCYQMKC